MANESTNNLVQTNLIRANPVEIHSSLKEAVADGLLNIIYQRVAGEGRYGKVLYRDKPSSTLTSGFLLPPLRAGSGMDENTSPIRLTSQGMDIQ